MARPSPRIVLSNTDKRWRTLDVLEPDGFWCVTYQGRLIALRTGIIQANGHKYPKSVFPSRGYAVSVAQRLNAMFRTTDFSVRELV